MSELLHKSPLGKNSQYETAYNPELLFPILRSVKRKELGIDSDSLSFYGRDLWYGYELSWLDKQGKPVVRVALFELPCHSPHLIESKSLKLYLNSFNQSEFSDESQVRDILEKDLSGCAGEAVKVTLMNVQQLETFGFQATPGLCIDDLDISVSTYSYNPDLLKKGQGRMEETIHTHLLKSNCPVTGQPDWGTLVIEYKGDAIDHSAFLQYICSFRDHQEFHEQCVERVFTDLQTRFEFEELTVYAQYLRRGGLDINPWRSTQNKMPKPVRFIRQ